MPKIFCYYGKKGNFANKKYKYLLFIGILTLKPIDMKRIFTSLIAIAAMLAGTTAWGQLCVAGHRVTTTGTETQTITGSGISGKVTYNPTYKYLVLENATITANGSDESRFGILNLTVEDLKIYFVGTCRITANSSSANEGAGIYSKQKTQIGSYASTLHTATVTVSNTGAGPAIVSLDRADIKFYGINLTATAKNGHAICAQKAAGLIVYCSNLTASAENSNYRAITGFTNGLGTTYTGCPLEVFDNSLHKFDIATGSVVNNGTPVQKTTLVPSIMIGDEALSYTVPEITTATTGASSVSGSVRFNPSASPWLELDGFSMTGKGITCRIPNLEVRIKGTNSIKTTASRAIGIEIHDNTTFTGSGSLKVECTGSNTSAISTYDNADVTLNINSLEAKGMNYAFFGESTSSLTLKGYSNSTTYKFVGGSCNVYTGNIVKNGVDIWTTDTYFNPKDYKVWNKAKGGVACGTDIGVDGTWFMSTSAFTYYPLFVAGTQVSDRNNGNVLSQYITGGKVTYDTGTKTLTLDGVQFAATGDDAPIGIDLRSTIGEATLKFTGADQHWTTDNDVFAFANSKTTISGNCVRVYLTSNKESGISTRGGASVTINKTGYFGSKGAKYGYWGNGATNEVLTLSKTTEDDFGYNFEGAQGAIYNVYALNLDNMDFGYIDGRTLPGCYFDATKKCVAQNGGETAKGAVTLSSIKEKLPIYVAGKQLNNVYNVDYAPIYVGSPYISSGPMSVNYVPSTKTLTLTDATTVDHGNTGSVLTCGMAVLDEGVTIDVVGTNNINAGNYGIYATKTLTVGGSGNLNITSTETGALGLYNTGTEQDMILQCSGGTHTFKGKTHGFTGWGTSNLLIRKSSGSGALYKFAGETADIGTTKALKLGDGVRLHSRYTWFNEEKKAMYRYHEICKNSNIDDGTWIRGDVEWIDYPLYVCDHQLYGAYVDGNLKGPASGFCCKEYTGTGIYYDPESQTLTLNDVKIDSEDVSDAVKNDGVDELTIKLIGESDIKVRDNVFQLCRNTTITGDGTLRGEATAYDGYGVWLNAAEEIGLVLDGPTFEFKGQTAIGGTGDQKLSYNKGKLTFEPNDNPRSAFTGLVNIDFANDLAITEPEGAYFSKDLKNVTTDGEDIYKGLVVVDEVTPYALIIAGVRVNSANCTDILHDGVFAYAPETNTLTISGDCTYDKWIVENSIEDLTINVSGNSTLTEQDGPAVMRLFPNTTITGGKLTLKSEAPDANALGIYISDEGATLTIKDADIEVVGDGFEYGITGESECSLVIDNSSVSVSAHGFGCISDWGSINLTNCYIETPETSNIKANGIYNGAGDNFIGGGDATETIVIKAGELTGINELGVRSEELGVGNGQSTYDLNGRKVTTPEKGKIYIINGKKVKK